MITQANLTQVLMYGLGAVALVVVGVLAAIGTITGADALGLILTLLTALVLRQTTVNGAIAQTTHELVNGQSLQLQQVARAAGVVAGNLGELPPGPANRLDPVGPPLAGVDSAGQVGSDHPAPDLAQPPKG